MTLVYRSCLVLRWIDAGGAEGGGPLFDRIAHPNDAKQRFIANRWFVEVLLKTVDVIRRRHQRFVLGAGNDFVSNAAEIFLGYSDFCLFAHVLPSDPFYNLPRCSGVVHGYPGISCKTHVVDLLRKRLDDEKLLIFPTTHDSSAKARFRVGVLQWFYSSGRNGA